MRRASLTVSLNLYYRCLYGLQGSKAEILQHEKDASEHVEIMATYISQIEATLNQLKDSLAVCLVIYFIVYSIYTACTAYYFVSMFILKTASMF